MINGDRLIDSLVVVTFFFIGTGVTISIAVVIAKGFGLAGYLILLSFIFAVIATYIYKGINK